MAAENGTAQSKSSKAKDSQQSHRRLPKTTLIGKRSRNQEFEQQSAPLRLRTYWIDRESFDLDEDFAYSMSAKDKRQIRKIIYEHPECIEQQWDEFKRRRQR